MYNIVMNIVHNTMLWVCTYNITWAKYVISQYLLLLCYYNYRYAYTAMLQYCTVCTIVKIHMCCMGIYMGV